MSKRVLRKFIIIIISIIIAFAQLTISYGGLISSAQSESGPIPPTSPPPDDTGGGIIEPEAPIIDTGDKTVYHNYWDGVRGNAFEDLGIDVGSINGNNPMDSSRRIKESIKDVKVELLNSTGNVVRTTYTKEDGSYEFLGVSSGDYKVKFTYGSIEHLKSSMAVSNVADVQNILKYNGQDYMVESVGGSGSFSYIAQTYSIDRIIKSSGAGCAQVFLAIDCSQSMRNNKVIVNGSEKTMLEAQIDAAKSMVASLLDGTKNIFIGIVAFQGVSYRAVSLTDNIELLNKALDEEIKEPEWNTPNTDVGNALQKAYESFSNNDANSNRYILVLSDGVPTKYESIQVYNGEPEQDTYNKLVMIADKTRDKIKALEQDGVSIYGVFVSGGDTEEDEFIKNIFEDNCSEFYLESELNSILYKINENFKKYIIENIRTNESDDIIEEEFYSISGKEDAERREEVDNNYQKFYYNNTYDFSTIDVSVNNSNFDDFKDKAINVSDKTWMTAITGNLTMTERGSDWDEQAEGSYVDSNGDTVTYTYTIHHVWVEAIYGNQNLILVNRGRFNLVPKITATGLRITASNLQVLQTIEMTDEKLPLISYLETNLMHGTRVDIEYTIDIYNYSSDILCNQLSAVVYLPEGFGYNKKLQYITSKPEIECDIISISTDNIDYYKTQGLLDTDIDANMVMLTVKNDNLKIKPGNSIQLKIVVSKLISTDQEDTKYDAEVEILAYGNSSNRRMQYIDLQSKISSEYPGNKDILETDYSKSTNYATVVPPTGASNDMIYVYMAICVLTVLLVGVQHIKNKHQIRNNINNSKS